MMKTRQNDFLKLLYSILCIIIYYILYIIILY